MDYDGLTVTQCDADMILTIGHSTYPIEQFLALLHVYTPFARIEGETVTYPGLPLTE